MTGDTIGRYGVGCFILINKEHKYNNMQFNDLTKQIITEMAYGLGNFQPITLQEFLDIIMQYDNSNIGAKPISFTSVTNPVYRKKTFPYAKLYKVGQTAGMLNTDYEANVNAQRERENKEADFTKQQKSNVKEWLSSSIGITKTGLTIIKYRPLNPKPSFFIVQTNDGQFKEVSKDEIVPFLSTPSASGQGLDKEISYRLYGVDKIIAASFQNKEYIITDADETRKQIFSLVQDKLAS